MASRSKTPEGVESGSKAPAESEAPDAKLAKMLAEADPKDGEQPKPVSKTTAAARKGNGEKKDEKVAEEKPAKAKTLKLSEVEGDVKDGEKIRIGVEVWSGDKAGSTVIRTLVVPKKFSLAKPVKGNQVHVIDDAHPERTLCTLATNWVSGRQDMPTATPITCIPCQRRMIAINKTTKAIQDKLRADMEAAQVKAAADAKAAKEAIAQAKADVKAAAEAKTDETVEDKPAETKPARRRKAA